MRRAREPRERRPPLERRRGGGGGGGAAAAAEGDGDDGSRRESMTSQRRWLSTLTAALSDLSPRSSRSASARSSRSASPRSSVGGGPDFEAIPRDEAAPPPGYRASSSDPHDPVALRI